MHNLNKAIIALRPLFNAIPREKFQKVAQDAEMVEIGLRQSAMLLNNLRSYFLANGGGEDSPFVKKIDELLSRPNGPQAAKSAD